MPIYEYQCSECGVHFDKLQRFGDPKPEFCPNGHSQVQRRLSQPTIIFKGSGFYVTDNGRNGRYKSPQKKEKDANPATSTSAKPKDEAGATDKPSSTEAG